MLWQTLGSPEPAAKRNHFRDVKPEDSFYKAALWCDEHKLFQNGYYRSFQPNALCSNVDLLVQIWKSEGRPEPDGYSGYASSEVNIHGYWYEKALIWADSLRYLPAGNFTIEHSCSRAQALYILYRHWQHKNGISGDSALYPPTRAGFYAMLLDALKRGDASVEFDTRDFDTMSRDELYRTWRFMNADAPWLMGTVCGLGLGYETTQWNVELISLSEWGYDYETMRAFCQAWIDALLAPVQENWTDLQKVVYIHDAIASAMKGSFYGLVNLAKFEDCNMYDVIRTKTAICSGFTALTRAVLSAAGIENAVAHYMPGTSKETDPWMEKVDLTTPGHVWNMVRIDGEWYQMDVTWDAGYLRGRVQNRRYFLLSTEELERRDPDGYHKIFDTTADGQAVSKRFESGWFWNQNGQSSSGISDIVPAGDRLYYVDLKEGRLRSWDGKGQNTASEKDLNGVYQSITGRSLSASGASAAIDLAAHDGILYLTMDTLLLRYRPATGQWQILNESESHTYNSCWEQDGKLAYCVDNSSEVQTMDFPPVSSGNWRK